MKKQLKDEFGETVGTIEYKKIKPVEISPEVMQLRPFILPVKGFGMDEVLSLIQKVVDSKSAKPKAGQ